jgi:hypothetical protein
LDQNVSALLALPSNGSGEVPRGLFDAGVAIVGVRVTGGTGALCGMGEECLRGAVGSLALVWGVGSVVVMLGVGGTFLLGVTCEVDASGSLKDPGMGDRMEDTVSSSVELKFTGQLLL